MASKWLFSGTSPITPVITYLNESAPILRVLSMGFSFPKSFFAVVSEITTLWGVLRRLLLSPLSSGIEKISKKAESAFIT